MARRVIATAEVQVAADTKQAEARLERLAESFAPIGRLAAQAAERVEATFFEASRKVETSFRRMDGAVIDVLSKMQSMGMRGRVMAETFAEAADAARQLAATDIDAAAVQMLRVLREATGTLGAMEEGFHKAGHAAKVLAEREAEAAREAAALAEEAARIRRLEQAFRSVGTEIDLVMAGGRDGLENDIRAVIRRLDDMGGEFAEVARIGERALDGVLDNFNEDAHRATIALTRLDSQLHSVADIGDRALEGLEQDLRQSTAQIERLSRSARQAETALGGMARRTSSDLRGLVTMLGAAGVGMAAERFASFGLSMTQELEKADAMFRGLTGSVEGASNMLERMVRFARDTPYNLANVTNAAAQLLAVGDGFGVTTQNIEEYLTTFGEAIQATGGSDEHFTRLVRVFGQMSSSGKVLGQDMNQLAQNLPGYDVWQALADGANTSVAELRRLQDLGKLDELLTGNEAVEILIAGMKELPGAAGSMERRMQTLGGALEKFKETTQLAVSNGMQPFAETLQTTMSNPVTLRAVERLSESFGDMASKGLEAVAPHLDYMAEAMEHLFDAMAAAAPLAGTIAEALGDLISVAAPLTETFFKATDAVLNFGDGIGKLGVAALAFAAGGPIGAGIGVLTAVSGAIDLVAGRSRDAAEMTRLFAAAQADLNGVIRDSEVVHLSTAQQLAVDTAQELMDRYGGVADAMLDAGLTVNDLTTALGQVAAGADPGATALKAVTDEILRLTSDETWSERNDLQNQLDDLVKAYVASTEAVAEETEEQGRLHELAGTQAIGAAEAAAAARADYLQQMEAAHDAEIKASDRRVRALEADANKVVELTDEQTESLIDLLQDQVDAYEDWAAGINESTNGAALSLSSVAKESDNDAKSMIKSIQEHAAATAAWKENIVTAASQLSTVYGVPDEAAREFMATLGEMGPEAGAALQEMLEDAAAGGNDLLDFFNAVQTDAAVMSSSMVDAYDEAVGAPDTLVESLSKGTLTIEELMQQLPEYIEAAGPEMEAAASAIDLSDEMFEVGTDAANGLIRGLETAYARISAAAVEAGRRVAGGTSGYLQVQSPSRVMFGIGEFAAEGLIEGFQSLSQEAEVVAIMVAEMMTGGIAQHFRKSKNAIEEARKFSEKVAKAIVDELLAEREAVADAAEELARAASDRLDEVWDRIRGRFEARDIREGIAEAKAELAEAEAQLASARALAGAEGRRAVREAEARLAAAQKAIEDAKKADERGDRLAEQARTDLKRRQEDEQTALNRRQASEIEAIQARIADANRNLDVAAREAAEAELAAAKERHEAEKTAMKRRHEDENSVLKQRLDNENKIREAAIRAKEDEARELQRALDKVVKEVEDAIKNMAKYVDNVAKSQRGVQDAYMRQFERMLENISIVDAPRALEIARLAGLSQSEAHALVSAAMDAQAAEAKAKAAAADVGNLLNILSSGLFKIGANGALGIVDGINSEARAIAEALLDSVQAAVKSAMQAMEIRSPSRRTSREIGRPMGQGVAEGLDATLPEVGYSMRNLLDQVVNGTPLPSASQLVGAADSSTTTTTIGSLVSMPNAVIQDATDADLVAQRTMLALQATGVL